MTSVSAVFPDGVRKYVDRVQNVGKASTAGHTGIFWLRLDLPRQAEEAAFVDYAFILIVCALDESRIPCERVSVPCVFQSTNF